MIRAFSFFSRLFCGVNTGTYVAINNCIVDGLVLLVLCWCLGWCFYCFCCTLIITRCSLLQTLVIFVHVFCCCNNLLTYEVCIYTGFVSFRVVVLCDDTYTWYECTWHLVCNLCFTFLLRFALLCSAFLCSSFLCFPLLCFALLCSALPSFAPLCLPLLCFASFLADIFFFWLGACRCLRTGARLPARLAAASPSLPGA